MSQKPKTIAIEAHIIRTTSGRYVERLLHHLQAVDTHNRYVVILDKADYDWWQPIAPNFTKIAFSHKRFSIINQFKLAWVLYKLKAELVHFAMQPDTFMPFAGLLYFKQKVFTIHDLTQLRIKNYKRGRLAQAVIFYGFKVLLRLNAWSAKAIIVPSEFVKKDVSKYLGVSLRKIHVTYEAADLDKQPAKPLPVKQLLDNQFILYVGTIHNHKNLPRLIDAFKLLQKDRSQLRLALAGKKEPVFHDRLTSYIKSNDVTGTDILGFVEDSQLAWLYQNCLCYVFPSLSEGFGLPGLEAMGYGAPVASSSATCLPEIYGQAAHYFEPTNPDDIANSINEILSNKELRETLIKNGYQQLHKYSWKKMAEQTLRVYESLIN